MMEIRVKQDSIEVSGYVNAVERNSKPLRTRIGRFIERIRKGAFKRSLERNDDVRILLNHDETRDLGGTKDGNLELTEDNIGLHARATITDPDVVGKGRNGDLVGWSFGFYDRDVDDGKQEDGMILRDVKDLDLKEVSILDRTRTPAYDGTLLMVRADDDAMNVGEAMLGDVQITEERAEPEEVPEEVPEQHENVVDYTQYENMIAEMKGEQK
ncbi:MAG: HK97 family phage prohead protease [Anaerolineaceae bacterium]|nr:HK97 family phage prohead protease [Anaerolineaceae bacterium]